jgi:HD-like signal output (HDOD) protein
MWRELWSHSVASAIVSTQILAAAPMIPDDDTDYLVGLLHNIGKIVMAYAFPDELMTIARTPCRTPADVCAREREMIGWDHAQIGAYYLERHQIAEEIVFAVRHHHEPSRAPCHHFFAAAVQVADTLVRHAGIPCGFEQVDPIETDSWIELPGWQILYGGQGSESDAARTALPLALKRLPAALKGLY